jgi:hypothetical protein
LLLSSDPLPFLPLLPLLLPSLLVPPLLFHLFLLARRYYLLPILPSHRPPKDTVQAFGNKLWPTHALADYNISSHIDWRRSEDLRGITTDLHLNDAHCVLYRMNNPAPQHVCLSRSPYIYVAAELLGIEVYRISCSPVSRPNPLQVARTSYGLDQY